MAIWAADVCSRAARQLIRIEPTGLRLRHIGQNRPIVWHSPILLSLGPPHFSARTGFRTVTSRLPWCVAVED